MEERGREGSVTSAMLPLMLTLVFMHMLILVLMKLMMMMMMMLLTDDEAGDDDDVDDSAIGMEGRGSSCNPSHPSPARWLMLELLPAPRKPRITTHNHPPSIKISNQTPNKHTLTFNINKADFHIYITEASQLMYKTCSQSLCEEGHQLKICTFDTLTFL